MCSEVAEIGAEGCQRGRVQEVRNFMEFQQSWQLQFGTEAIHSAQAAISSTSSSPVLSGRAPLPVQRLCSWWHVDHVVSWYILVQAQLEHIGTNYHRISMDDGLWSDAWSVISNCREKDPMYSCFSGTRSQTSTIFCIYLKSKTF